MPPRPTSNCGLISSTKSAPGSAVCDQRGQHLGERDEGEVGDDQAGALGHPGGRGDVLGGGVAHVDPLDEGEPRLVGEHRGASWPCPTSTAMTSAAPRSSSTWLNPPVDAPASSAVRPVDVDAEGVQGGDEFVGASADVVVGRRDLDDLAPSRPWRMP